MDLCTGDNGLDCFEPAETDMKVQVSVFRIAKNSANCISGEEYG